MGLVGWLLGCLVDVHPCNAVEVLGFWSLQGVTRGIQVGWQYVLLVNATEIRDDILPN